MLKSVLAILVATTVPLSAATFDDPDWPCIQRKVPELSIGQMWAGPEVTDPIRELARDADIREAAGPLVARRNTQEEFEAMIDEYAAGLGEDKSDKMTALFLASFNQISHERTQIINGIARYAHKQTDLAEQIDIKRQELAELNAVADDEKNWDRIEELQDTLVWDERIYNDRRQSLTYVCETPVLLEQRAFAIGHAIMSHLE
jgi:hypothetical protein